MSDTLGRYSGQFSANSDRTDKKHHFLGRFKTIEEAANARMQAERALHGKFARPD